MLWAYISNISYVCSKLWLIDELETRNLAKCSKFLSQFCLTEVLVNFAHVKIVEARLHSLN